MLLFYRKKVFGVSVTISRTNLKEKVCLAGRTTRWILMLGSKHIMRAPRAIHALAVVLAVGGELDPFQITKSVLFI